VGSGAGSARTARFRMGGNALELGLRVHADPVRVNTRGFRWCDGIPQDPTEHQRLYFIELHGYFYAGDCSGSRNEE